MNPGPVPTLEPAPQPQPQPAPWRRRKPPKAMGDALDPPIHQPPG